MHYLYVTQCFFEVGNQTKSFTDFEIHFCSAAVIFGTQGIGTAGIQNERMAR